MGKRALSIEELTKAIEDVLWKVETLKYPIQDVIKKEDVQLWNESLILIEQETGELYGRLEDLERNEE